MNSAQLLKYFDRVGEADDVISRLRRFILDLAVRGKAVEQDPADEPASELIGRICSECERLTTRGRNPSANHGRKVVADRHPFDLPRSWVWSKLGEVAQYGRADKVESNKGIPARTWVLDLEDVEKDTSRLVERIRSSDRPFQSAKTRFQRGDVLFGKLRPYLNKVIVADEDGVCTSEIVPIHGFQGIAPEYIRLVLKSPLTMNRVDQLMYGMKMPRLGTADAMELNFPLPPSAEQRRIVAKVNELMALCDRLEAARTEREATRTRLTTATLARLQAPDLDPVAFAGHTILAVRNLAALTARTDQVMQLRRTILTLALCGRLVPQNSNDEPASALLARIETKRSQLLESDYPNPDEARAQLRKMGEQEIPARLDPLPAGWSWATLWQCSAVIVDCKNKTAPYATKGIRLIRTTNVRNGRLNSIDQKYVDQKTYEIWSARCTPEPGDILITREAPMGEVCLIPQGERICLGQRMMLARLVPNTIDPNFMIYSLRDPRLMDRVQDKPIGATVQHLRVGGVETLLVPLPPLGEQRRIVAKLDELMTLCDRLEASLARGEEGRSRLLEAVLHEALAPSMAKAA